MLISRGLLLPNAFKLSTSRFLARKPMLQVAPRDVDVLTNPTGEYLDAFMKACGNDRTVFKAEDLALWQNSFDDYKFKLTCLKGTKEVIGTCHFVTFHPINPKKESIVFSGFGWMAPEYRTMNDLKFQHDIFHESLVNTDTNIVGQLNDMARNFWHLMCEITDDKETAHNSADLQYKSFYDAKDVVIPDNLDTSGITLRNAREVPKKDIIKYDQDVHPYHRERYIIAHMYDRDGFAKVAYDEDGKVIGIGQAIIYKNKNDCNLGPIYADEPRVAQAMLAEMLRDIKKSGKEVSLFEVRSGQMAGDSFRWIAPFLKCEPSRVHVCNLLYKHWAPPNIDFTKVYSPTHAQLMLV
ncbi:hypothetical protein CAEBREN_25716 [Caenorhabditis brenneri]|uniref:DUF1248 domain-containing protein n=1 Tax=Caenorhabditis brenneri TaxID=135651 RepID=G0NZY8_CAEBE|nr:hypothetical protein CAEBREN_25716 [Caenorhabditis brenneri]